MVDTQQAQQQLDELKKEVIGLFKGRNSNVFELVINCQEANDTIDVIRVTQFAEIQKQFKLATHFGKLQLFPNNKNMYQMLNNPFEWAEFIEDFNK